MQTTYDSGTSWCAVDPTELEILQAIAAAAGAFQVADAARSIDSAAVLYTTTTKYLEARAYLNECLELLRRFTEARGG